MFTLRRFDVPVLAPDAEPLRVLHLSDLHLTPGQRRKQRWVRELAGLDPDLVVVTGDNMAHPDAVPGVLRAPTSRCWTCPGAFVFGSNDYTRPGAEEPVRLLPTATASTCRASSCPTRSCATCFTGAGWADLNNARTTLKAGGRVGRTGRRGRPAHRPRRLRPSPARPSPTPTLRIALTHSPEPRVLDAMAADGFDLLLAGHTHGGQVCVPGFGALVTNCGLTRSMATGLHRWPGSDVLAARLRRPGHPPDRPDPLRLPARRRAC